MEPAPCGVAGILPATLDEWPLILVDRMLANGRHLVLGDRDGVHRIWLPRTATASLPLAYVIAADRWIDRRYAVARRLDRRLAGAAPVRSTAGTPSLFQRRRLAMLLAILDDLLVPREVPVTAHAIATRHVYAGMTIAPGAAWKSSSERRRTQRLIDEARALMNGGYRALLQN